MEYNFNETEEAIAAIQEMSENVRQATEELKKEREEVQKIREELAEDDANDRRQGKAGSDWKVIQKRIDNGETTFLDVINGNDDSVEAESIRKKMHENADEAFEKIDEMLEDDDDDLLDFLFAIGRDDESEE
ncbi:hypothetical protein FACS1894125_6370 [Actinomycetota bacterium]|nr:hypothetical protein FACS1894125_6370 [Actinomycetota bacterium]